jgi:hypothetical protein
MKAQSVFTYLLNELLKYSKRNDAAASNYTDLVNIQKLEQKIIAFNNNNCLNFAQYKVLYNTCTQIKTEMREVIRINQEVKAIERQLRRSRRKSA